MILQSFILMAAASAMPAYAYLAPRGDVWQVWSVQGGSEARMLTQDNADKVHLSRGMASGDLLVLTRDGRGLVIDRDGGIRETIDLGAGVSEAALSPDGKLLAMVREEMAGAARERHIWILDRRDGSRRRLVKRGGIQRSPEFSADGTSIIFAAGLAGASQDLWRLRLDGSSEEQLTVGSGVYLDPAIGPDGSVFVAANKTGSYDIWRLDPKTQEMKQAIVMPGQEGQPALSRDGRSLLFVHRDRQGSAVWISATDGSGARRLTDPAGEVRYPIWIDRAGAEVMPASQPLATDESEGRIAFLKVTDGTWQPWEIHPDGSGLRPLGKLADDVSRLTSSADGSLMLANALDGTLHLLDHGAAKEVKVEPSGCTDAALSPDGKRIVYSVNTLESIDANDLWLVPVAGGRAHKLTDQPYLQHFPVWAGINQIYYLSGRGGQSHDIWSVDAGTGKAHAVVAENLYNFEPAVSSRGDVAFSSNRGGDYDIWLLRQGATQPEQITNETGYDGQPAFSPDGRHLVHVARRAGASRLVVRDLSGGGNKELELQGDVRLPIWYGSPGRQTARLLIQESGR